MNPLRKFAVLAVPAFLCMLLYGASAIAGPCSPSSPALSLILPRGIQRGGEHTLTFSGARLNDAEEIFLYDKGVEVTKIEVVDANSINVTVNVAADCRLGEHLAQVRTRSGISDYRSFYVGALQEQTETEPNNSIETAQRIELNTTVNGTILNEDVDYFVVSAKQDQRLSVEIEAIRLGAMFDPFIAVVNQERFELGVSDDSPQFKQDGFVSIRIPADGEYYVLVREAAYGGNDNCRYRLHVGNFPRPGVAFPAGGKAGDTTEVTFMGDPLGDVKKEIKVPEKDSFRGGYFFEDEFGIVPSPVEFRISEMGNNLEQEPNDSFDQATETLELPIAINGIITAEDKADFFKFSARKDQAFDVHCLARQIGSGLDPVINIFGPDKKPIVGDDDARRPDCYLRFQAPGDGEYYLRVRDHLGRGQRDFVYRVEMTPANPRLAFQIPRVDRYSQQRQQIAVPQGNRFATLIQATRDNFGGPLSLVDEDFPAGIKMFAPPMDDQLNLMPVVFEAGEDAPVAGHLVDLKGRHQDEAKNITGNFVNVAEFALGEPNNTRYFASRVERLAMAVTDKVPFKLEIVQPVAPIVRNGSKSLRIVAKRDEGFTGEIRIEFPFRPPGIGTRPQVNMPPDKTEVDFPLDADGNARVGKWPIYAIGWSDVNGPAWVSTQLAELEVAEPFVVMEMQRAKCAQGESARIECKLNQLVPFEGEATAEILGIPPQINIPPLKFTKDTTELVFDVTTTDQSPIGKHGSMFCRVTINVQGEEVVSRAGSGEIQITKPAEPSDLTAADQNPKPHQRP